MAKSGRLARGGVAMVAITCALHVHCGPSAEVSTSSFPDAERMMSQARLPHADERGGFVLDTHRQTMTARVDGSSVIAIDTLGAHARIERLGPPSRTPRLRGNVIRTSGEVERFVFARGEEIEELALLARPTPLEYRLQIPDGFRLRALSPTLVQVDDAKGDPWLRMRADRAWSEDGHEVAVSLATEGDVVRVVVPRDAPYPLLVDPIWAAATTATAAREWHAATLLGDGRVLITGGFATAQRQTAEIYDPRTGIFTALSATMKAGRASNASIMLPSGKVLQIGWVGLGPVAEVFDPKTQDFTAIATKTTMEMPPTQPPPHAWLPDGKLLLKGYANTQGDSPPAAEIFDPTSGTFTATSAGTLPARGTMVSLPNGKALLFGECEIESFDPVTTSWTKMNAQFCGQPENRGVAVMHDGRVLVVGPGGGPDCPNGEFCTVVRAYDPATDSYDAVTALTLGDGRNAPATVLPSGKVLVTGGYVSTSVARVYDPATNTLVADPSGTTSTHRHATATLLPGGDVLLVGGEQNTTDVRTFLGSITPTTGNMVSPRYAAATQRLLDGTVLIAGGSFHPAGSAATTYATAELYDPATGTFSATGSMTTPRENAIVELLPNGKVLVAGGDEAGTDAAKSSAEVYDPGAKQFTAVGSMTAARTRHASVQLTNGRILVTGGCSNVSACIQGLDATASRLKSAELFDTSSETFTATQTPMLVARSEHGMVAMRDGRVLVVGTQGQGGGNTESYDPKKGFFDIEQTLYLPTIQHGRSALLLPSGKVFVGGGPFGPNLITDATVANPQWTSAAGIGFGLSAAQYMPTLGAEQLLLVGGVKSGGNGLQDPTLAESRIALYQLLVAQNAANVVADAGAAAARRDVATALVDHGILVAGGDSAWGSTDGTVTNTAYVHSDGAPDSIRPVLSGAPASIKAGTETTLTGQRFTSLLGDTPVAFWQPAGTKTFIATRITEFTATTAKWTAPTTVFHGTGWLHLVRDGIASNSMVVAVEPAAEGIGCKIDAECAKGFCTEGVCCDARCDGDCQACTARRKGSGSDGKCEALVPGKDPDKKCVRALGQTCAAGNECGSGFCSGGACCDRACTGNCESCTVTRGICKVVEPCGDAGTEPIICDGHTVKQGEVVVAECRPYLCNGETCRNECASADDCVGPTICSYDGKCIDPPNVTPANESLFGCASSGRPSGSFAALGVLLALGAARIARRRRGDPC